MTETPLDKYRRNTGDIRAYELVQAKTARGHSIYRHRVTREILILKPDGWPASRFIAMGFVLAGLTQAVAGR